MSKTVTIVVPVYGDWASLTQCIESLKIYADSSHKVIFVNDCGPEVELLEKNIKKAINGFDNFIYHRNEKNLGFVGTCNRAALELDETNNDILLLNSDTIVTAGFLEELVDVLYISDKHGAVCPRSSNATIASVPFRYRTIKEDRDPAYAMEVYQQIKDRLPRYIVSPVAVGFCMLIKRSLIQNFGLFDPVYGLGYSEENDFCLRINKYGYSSVIANHSFVYHLESKSFTSEKKAKLVANNEAFMMGRYPYYRKLVERYIDNYIDPIDWFADTIVENKKPLKVLINLYHLPLSFNGTSRNALSFLSFLAKTVKSKDVDIAILAHKDAIEFHALDSYGFRMVDKHNIEELFHIGYSPSQIFHYENLQLLNKYCLKIVISDLDIISIRNNDLLSGNFLNRSIFIDSFKVADRIVSISNFTTKDTLSYFGEHLKGMEKKFTTIHQGFPGKTFDEGDAEYGKDAYILPKEVIDEGNYLLVIGNDYSHKLVNEAIDSMSEVQVPIVIIGTSHAHQEGLYAIPSGSISDAYMETIIESSGAILFPSQYEGFGLPVAEAAFYQKNIILANTEVAHEVASIYEKNIHCFYFDTLSQIPELVKHALEQKVLKSKSEDIRTLDDYNADVWGLLQEVALEPVNDDELRNRWHYFAQLREYASVSGVHVLNTNIRLSVLNVIRKNPRIYNSLRDFYRLHIK
jgi:GT2 family glycosyltransferase